jgi:translation elongation factor EF-1alpha
MELQEAKEALDSLHPHKASAPLRLVIHQPGGIGGTPTVGVKAIHAGFDWDSNTILIYPEEQLTRLTPDEVAAITKSVSKGQSWHSYQQFKKYREQLAEATEEINRLRAELGRYQNNGRGGNAKTRNYQSRC